MRKSHGVVVGTIVNKDKLKVQIEAFCGNIESRNTARAYRADLHQFLSFLDELQTDASIAGPVHLLRYINRMKDRRSANTLNRQIGTLRSFYDYLVASGISRTNPAEGISKLPFESQVHARSLSNDEARCLLAAPDITTISGSRDRLVLVLLLLMGIRRSEVCHIKVKDISSNVSLATLTIKGNKHQSRLMMIPSGIKTEIECYQLRYKNYTGQQIKENDYLIQSGASISSLPVHDSTVRGIVRRYVKACKISPDITPESCRVFAMQIIRDSSIGESLIVEEISGI